MGKQFLQLIDKHFPPSHALHKLFNRTNLKISYSCAPNLEKIIKKHNRKVLNKKKPSSNQKKCSCRDITKCPMKGRCLESGIIYQAEISTTQNPQNVRYYIGMTKNDFKTRLATHQQNFNKQEQKACTKLSKWYWYLVEKKENPIIKWSILAKAPTCRSLKNDCLLCTSEKLELLSFPKQDKLLNARADLTSKCLHRRFITLACYPPKKKQDDT